MPKKPSTVIGISYGHGDSSAALVVEGRLVAAAEEERFTRVKHYALFPTKAIEYCLRHAKINPQDVDIAALARKPDNAFWKRLRMSMAHPGLFDNRTKSRGKQESLGKLLKASGLKSAKLARVEHHLAHLMSVKYIADT